MTDLGAIVPEATAEMERFLKWHNDAPVSRIGAARGMARIVALLADERGHEPPPGDLADMAEACMAGMDSEDWKGRRARAADFMTFAEREVSKRDMAAAAAASVQDGDRIGICGDFSIEWIIQRLAARVRESGMDIACTPSKRKYAAKLGRSGIGIQDNFAGTFDNILCGASRVDASLNLIMDSIDDRAMICSGRRATVCTLGSCVSVRFEDGRISADVNPADCDGVMERIGDGLGRTVGDGWTVECRLARDGSRSVCGYGMNKIDVSAPCAAAPLAALIAGVEGVVGTSFVPVAALVPHAAMVIGVAGGGTDTIVYRSPSQPT